MSKVTNPSTLTIDGLTLIYSVNGQKITAKYDAPATCDLLKNAGLIEDFTTDSNGEPVVLFSDNNTPVGYGYELWCDFIKSFPFCDRVAEMLAEYRENYKAFARIIGKCNYLLHPLQATA
jgi:hypothetical protein